MSFENLKLIEPLLRALKAEGYTTPTPIQEKAIPIILDRKDLLGCAQTGTGKTAAFALPIIQILQNAGRLDKDPKKIKCLILTPTRELAIQIGESFAAYGKFTGIDHAVIFGGVKQRAQTRALEKGFDVLVATPGRLLDLMNQQFVSLKHLDLFVLDEADRMLDMGFINDVKKVLKALPAKRQTLFFSATMPPEIVKLAEKILNNPVKVQVTPPSSTADTIQQSVYYVDKADKKDLLIHVLKDKAIESALIFTRTKHGANKVTDLLRSNGINSEAIHGNKSQNSRQNALQNFKNKLTRVLVATDIAARGIDIDDLSHVINYEIPNVPETYVHRIGRTGRAGLNGISISFCDSEEKMFLRDIHKLISKTIPVIESHPYPMTNQRPQEQESPKNVNSGNSQRYEHRGDQRQATPKNMPSAANRQASRPGTNTTVKSTDSRYGSFPGNKTSENTYRSNSPKRSTDSGTTNQYSRTNTDNGQKNYPAKNSSSNSGQRAGFSTMPGNSGNTDKPENQKKTISSNGAMYRGVPGASHDNGARVETETAPKKWSKSYNRNYK